MSFQYCEPTYSAFTDFLKYNQPCLFGRELCEDWPARQLWRLGPDQPDWEHLAQYYGSATVTLWDCISGRQEETSVADALRCMKTASERKQPASEQSEQSVLYIKDWHLALHCDKHRLPPFYSTPAPFRDDWMNDFYFTRGEDFRFVYAGMKDSFTGVHSDVYGSYSWSTNVVGRKRWWFVAPEHAVYLRRFPASRTSELVSDFRHVDRGIFKDFDKAHVCVVEQQEGETIFVPSGWYHMVLNLTDCISINHNWCNSHNIGPMYHAIKDHVEDAEAALSDVRELLHDQDAEDWEAEFTRITQDVLKQDSGWDLITFWEMLAHQVQRIRSPAFPLSASTWICGPESQPDGDKALDIIRLLLVDFEGRAELQHLSRLREIFGQIANTLEEPRGRFRS